MPSTLLYKTSTQSSISSIQSFQPFKMRIACLVLFYIKITMLIKITLVITIVLYAFIVAQSLFYILAMSSATKKMHPAVYIETRKLIDHELQSTLALVYYAALAVSIALIAFCVVNPNGILFTCAIIGLVALLLDVAIALKGNVPLNRTINSWTASEYPGNWKQVRTRWFTLYHIRQFMNIAGFLALVIGMVFGL